MLHSFRGRGRRLVVDALIAVASMTVVLLIVVAIDDRAGAQMARVIASGAPAETDVAMQMRDETMTLARSVWEMSQMHAPLTTFVVVGAILVLFMLRTK